MFLDQITILPILKRTYPITNLSNYKAKNRNSKPKATETTHSKLFKELPKMSMWAVESKMQASLIKPFFKQ